jgi:hypothetical protein
MEHALECLQSPVAIWRTRCCELPSPRGDRRVGAICENVTDRPTRSACESPRSLVASAFVLFASALHGACSP